VLSRTGNLQDNKALPFTTNSGAASLKRIEICGGIATGKSWLARSLAHYGPYQLVEERFREIPFWEKFYTAAPEARAKYEFQKNVSFILFHAESIREAKQSDSRDMVCDFAMFQDLAYAALSPDLPILESIYGRLEQLIGTPSVIIRLRCTPEIQLERIRRRGRGPELSIDRSYLLNLDKQIDDRLAKLRETDSLEVHAIDTSRTDFVSNPEAQRIAMEIAASLRRSENGYAR
jgi:deoxyadenosine/deoxycytidine kinase